ncbi:MAG: GNAT family N-acetyltransferase [Clostridium sp.]
MKELSTERLILRQWREDDYLDLYEYAKSELVGPRVGWMPHRNEDESKEIIKMLIKDGAYAIVLRGENKVIGSIGVHNKVPNGVEKKGNQREIGYCLNPKYWGNGYMPEATGEVVKYCFNELDLDETWIGHNIYNTNSQRVIEKCGFNFRLEVDDVLVKLNNKKVRNKLYSITREEYLNLK